MINRDNIIIFFKYYKKKKKKVNMFQDKNQRLKEYQE